MLLIDLLACRDNLGDIVAGDASVVLVGDCC